MTAFHKLRKADLISLLKAPQRLRRSTRPKEPVNPATILPTPEAMDEFEQQEMTKS